MFGENKPESNGGALSLKFNFQFFNIVNTSLNKNVAQSGNVGAIYFGSSCSYLSGGVSVQSSLFGENKPESNGGALSLKFNFQFFNIVNTSLNKNVDQSGNGGAINFGSSCSYLSIGVVF